jgi:hypothetical protein
MKNYHAIQTDFSGIYNDVPSLSTIRKAKPNLTSPVPELLKKAKHGDEEAIEILRKKYNLRRFVSHGKKII